MDRRTILAVVLSLAIYYAWLVFRGPQTPPGEPGALPDEVATAPAPTPTPAPAPAAVPLDEIPAHAVPFTLCGLEGEVTSAAGLTALAYPGESGPYAVTPLYLYLWDMVRSGFDAGPWRPYGDEPGPATLLSDRAAALALGSGTGAAGEPRAMRVTADGAGRIVAVGVTADGIGVERVLSEHRAGDVCAIAVETTWRNATVAPYAGTGWVSIHDHTPVAGSSYESQRQPTALVDGDVVYGGHSGSGCMRQGTLLDDDHTRFELPGLVSWFGVSDRYFGFYLVPPAALQPAASLAFTRIGAGDDAIDGGVLSFPLELASGAARTESFVAYAGPNHTKELAAVHPDLPSVVDLGFFEVFALPLLWLLNRFHAFTGNWGLSIILLTVLVKVLFYPLTHRQFVSMQKMQQIQPELQRIKEQFADDPQEQQRRTLQVMQERGANPITGCLPMFLQMPVFFALYSVLLACVELYHTEFLYLRDLASPDPYCVLPIVITLIMWLQQQFSTPAANMDPAQQQMMKWIPIVFGLFFFAMPSGLGLYVLVNTALSILQQWWIKRTVGAPPPAPSAAGT